jgi:type IV secretory pathway VirB10-like protein
MAPAVKNVKKPDLIIGKVAFGKLPDNAVLTAGAAIIALILIYVVYRFFLSPKSTKITSSGAKSKKSPAKASPAAKETKTKETPSTKEKEVKPPAKDTKTPKKAETKTPKKASNTTPEDTAARKSERLRSKTPKKWD